MKNISPIVDIAKKVCPAVITIIVSKDLPKVEGFYLFPFQGRELILPKIKKGKGEMTKIGGGSGFIVSPDGYILTSCHVVQDPKAEYTIVAEPNKKYPAKILARDPINDIAILKIKSDNLPYLDLDDSEKIELGQEIVAVGNALGEFHDTVSSGIISGLSRFIQATNSITHQSERLRGLIQTDAAINPGNSGGPLVNMESKVIGINTAMVMGAQNIGFAIPINIAKKDLEEVKKYGKIKFPFLGIRYILITKEMAKQNKLPIDYGVLIVRENLGESPIVKGSAAERAGLKEFDIITEAEKMKIDPKNTLSQILQKCKIGQEVELKVLRGGKKLTLKVKLEEKK
ncbi:MAG: trypsin-like peptidase domain-containing protein [Candidatus Nealsonbacteria bacterium]